MMLIMLIVAIFYSFFVLGLSAKLTASVYLHRSITHLCCKFKKPSEICFRIICWLLLGNAPREFAGVHKKHHRFTDEDGDPHSPLLEGFWKVQLGNIFYYQRELKNIDLNYWAKGVPNYGWVDRHGNLGLLAGFLISCVIFTAFGKILGLGYVTGLVFGALAHLLFAADYLLCTGAVNALCHKLGYKTFKDAPAYNVRTVAILTCGEGLHNNHHKRPNSPKLNTNERWGEIDLGWRLLRLLDRIGQIDSKKSAFPPK